MPSFAIVTTRNLPEAYFLAAFLESRGQRLALVNLERRPLRQTLRIFGRLGRRRGIRYLADLLLARAFGARYLVGSDPFPEIDAATIARIRSAWPHVDAVDPHGPGVLSFVEREAPDYMLLAGAPLLKRELYGLAAHGALNRHLALLPDHRGSDCPVWMLALNQPTALGFSIHFVSDKVDAGDIVRRQAMPLVPGESLPHYLARLQRTASTAFTEVLEGLIEGLPIRRLRQETLGIQFPPATLTTLRSAARNYARLTGVSEGPRRRRLVRSVHS